MDDDRDARQLSLFGPSAAAPARARRLPLPSPDAGSSLGAAIGAFDQHLGRLGKTDNTRRAFASDLGILAAWLGLDRPVAAVDTEALRGFLTWLREGRGQACSAKSYARRMTTLKVFFAWLADSGAIPADPALPLVHLRAEPPLPLALTDGEAEALLAEAGLRRAEDPRPALLVRLLLDTGLKKGELVALSPEDLAPGAEPPSLLVRYDDPRWRQKERRVSFGPAVGPLLAEYRRRYPRTERLFGCTARNLEYVLVERVAAAGLPPRTSFETLRWTSALRAYRAGLDPDALRARLGLSPITWADTERKLALLAQGAGPAAVGPWFPG